MFTTNFITIGKGLKINQKKHLFLKPYFKLSFKHV